MGLAGVRHHMPGAGDLKSVETSNPPPTTPPRLQSAICYHSDHRLCHPFDFVDFVHQCRNWCLCISRASNPGHIDGNNVFYH